MSYSVILVTPILHFSQDNLPNTSGLPYDGKIIDLKHHLLVFAANFGQGVHSFAIELNRVNGLSVPIHERIIKTNKFTGIYCGNTSISENDIMEYYNKFPGWHKDYKLLSNDCQTLVIYMLAWLGLDRGSNTSDFEVRPDSNTDQQFSRERVSYWRPTFLAFKRAVSFIFVR